MSEPGLTADVTLSIQAALAQVGEIEAAITSALSDLVVTIDAASVSASVADAVAAADAVVAVQADTSEATGALDTLASDAAGIDPTLDVTADTTKAEHEIDDLATTASQVDATVDVTANTEQAQTEIDSLGSSSSAAAGHVGDLDTKVKSLEASTGIAEGSAAGLGSAIGGISPEAAGAVGAVAALGASAKGFFSDGLNAEAAAFRFRQQLGPLADEVQHIHVGDLNTDMEGLARATGSTVPPMEQAVAKIFQLGTANGTAGPLVGKTADQILALAGNARVLNPALGDTGTLAQNLVNGLARGGRFVAQYGISLNAAQIQQEAFNETGKTSVADLTLYDKAAAGATLATKQLGASLQENLVAGAKNPQLQLEQIKATFDTFKESVGAPLVAPILGVLQDLEKDAEPVAEALSKVLLAVLPLADTAAHVLLPPLELIDAIIKVIPPDLITLGAGAGLAAGGIAILTEQVAFGNPVLGAFALAVGGATAGLALYRTLTGSAHQDFISKEAESITQALKQENGQLDLSTQKLEKWVASQSLFKSRDLIGGLDAMGVSVERITRDLQQGTDGQHDFDKAVGASKITNAQLNAGLNATQIQALKYAQTFKDVQDALQKSAQQTLEMGVATGDLGQRFLDAADKSGNYVKALHDAEIAAEGAAHATLNHLVATGQLSAAQRDALVDQDRMTGGTADYVKALADARDGIELAKQAQHDFGASLQAVADTFPSIVTNYATATSGSQDWANALGDLAINFQRSGAGAEELDTIATGLGVTSDQLKGFIDDVNKSLDDFVSKAEQDLPSVGSAFDDAAKHAEKEKRTLSGQDILDALNETLKSLKSYSADLSAILGSSYADLAGFAAQQGPAAVHAIAESLKDPNHETLDAIRGNLEVAIPGAFNDAAGKIQQAGIGLLDANHTFAQTLATDFGISYDIANAIAVSLGAAPAAVQANTGPVQDANTVLGQAGQQALIQGLNDSLGSNVKDSVGPAVAGGIAAVVPDLTTPAGQAGAATQQAMVQGLLDSLGSNTSAAFDAAGAAVTGAAPGLTAKGEATGGAAGGATGRKFGSEVTVSIGKGMQDGAAHSAINSATANVTRYTQGRLEDGAASAGRKAGEEITAGLAKGMQDGASHTAVDSAAKNVVHYAEQQVKAHAQITSPSKLFAKVGNDISAGLAEGIKEVAPDVALAAQQAVTNAFADANAAAHEVQTLTLDPIQQGMLGFARSLDTAHLSADQFEQVAKALGVTVDQLHSFIDGTTKAVDDFANSVISKFPQISEAFQGATNVTDFIGNLRQQNIDAEKFMHNLQVIFAAGGKDLAGVLAQQGAVAGGSYAQELADQIGKGDRILVRDAEATVDEHNRIIRDMTSEVRNDFAPAVIESTGQLLNIADQTGVSGTEAGQAFADGLAIGISEHTANVQSAAAQIVADAEEAARAAAQSHSPSRLFARLGQDLSAGLADGLGGESARVVAEAEAIVQAAFDAMQSQLARTDPAGLISQALDSIGGATLRALPVLSAVQADASSAAAPAGGIGQVVLDARGMVFPGITTAAEAQAVGSAFMAGAIEKLRTSQAVQMAVKFQG